MSLTRADRTTTPGSRTGSRSSGARSCDLCDTQDELVGEVRITVVHEIAHHFGIDDARLHELGYG